MNVTACGSIRDGKVTMIERANPAPRLPDGIPQSQWHVTCRDCLRPGAEHRSSDGRCPGPGKFPTASRAASGPDGEKRDRALAAWDERIARFWSARSTVFNPLR